MVAPMRLVAEGGAGGDGVGPLPAVGCAVTKAGAEFGVPNQPGWIFMNRPAAAGTSMLNEHCMAEELSRAAPVNRAAA